MDATDHEFQPPTLEAPMTAVGLDSQLLILSHSENKVHWVKHASTHKQLWEVRYHQAPGADFWSASDWRQHVREVWAYGGTSAALSALAGTPAQHHLAFMRHFSGEPNMRQLAVSAIQEWGALWLTQEHHAGILHSATWLLNQRLVSAERLCQQMTDQGFDVSATACMCDAWGRNPVHIAARDGRIEDIASLLRLCPEAGFQKDFFGGTPQERVWFNASRPLSSQPSEVAALKVCVVGDSGVGKSAMIKRLVTGEFDMESHLTPCLQVSPVHVQTSKGVVRFDLWDCGSSQSRLGTIGDGFYSGGHAGITMFDVTSRITFKNVPRWCRDLERVMGKVPIVLVGNKADSVADRQRHRKVKPEHVERFHGRHGRAAYMTYIEMSVKSNCHLEEALQVLVRELLGPEIEFLRPPTIPPAREMLETEIEP